MMNNDICSLMRSLIQPTSDKKRRVFEFLCSFLWTHLIARTCARTQTKNLIGAFPLSNLTRNTLTKPCSSVKKIYPKKFVPYLRTTLMRFICGNDEVFPFEAE